MTIYAAKFDKLISQSFLMASPDNMYQQNFSMPVLWLEAKTNQKWNSQGLMKPLQNNASDMHRTLE